MDFNAGLFPLNDSEHNVLPDLGCLTNNLDLVFCAPGLVPEASFRLGSNSYFSDKVPLFGRLDASNLLARPAFNRFNVSSLG